MRARRAIAVVSFVSFVVLWDTGLPAAGTDFGGISFLPPPGWTVEDRARVRTAVGRRSASADVDSLVAVWRDGRAPVGTEPPRMVFARSSPGIAVSRAARHRAGLLVEEAVRSASGVRDFRVRGVEVVEVGGVPAYRFRAGLTSGGVEREQLIYVLGGAETYLFAFSAPRRRYAGLEPAFEGVVSSVRVSRCGGGRALWLWGGVLGGLLFCVSGASSTPWRG